MKTTARLSFFAAAMVTLVPAIPAAHADGDHRAKAITMMKQDFVTKGQAKADRIFEDGLQAVCNRTGNNPPEYLAKQTGSRPDGWRQIPRRRQADGRLESQAKRSPNPAVVSPGLTSRTPRSAATATTATRSRPAKLPSAPSVPACFILASCAATRRKRRSMSTARSTTPSPSTSVPRCRASAISAPSRNSRSRIWLPCCWTRTRPVNK